MGLEFTGQPGRLDRARIAPPNKPLHRTARQHRQEKLRRRVVALGRAEHEDRARLHEVIERIDVADAMRVLGHKILDSGRARARQDLMSLLVGRRAEFVGTFTEKLLTYALGRGIDASDAPAVRAIGRATLRDGDRWSSIILAIARSTPFQMKMRLSEELPIAPAR